jgi:FkbM family methyltransferase
MAGQKIRNRTSNRRRARLRQCHASRLNLELNAIKSEVLEAAIGPHEGTARFESSRVSNLERLSEKGVPVPMITVDTILRKSACSRLGLVKIDIEGGEQQQQLFDGPLVETGWTV